MAASGIAEHAEARRRQIVIDRRAHWMKQALDACERNPDLLTQDLDRPQATYNNELSHHQKERSGHYSHVHLEDSYHRTPCSAYEMRRVGSPPGFENYEPPIYRKMRREHVKNQQLCEYSAKLPGRLTSTDFTQQW